MDLIRLLLKESKMPIALVSIDSVNSQLSDFKDLTEVFHLVYVSTDSKAKEIYDKLSAIVAVERVTFTPLLDVPNNETDDQIKNRFQEVVDQCSGPYACLIITHHSVINTWRPKLINKEWTVI